LTGHWNNTSIGRRLIKLTPGRLGGGRNDALAQQCINVPLADRHQPPPNKILMVTIMCYVARITKFAS